MAADAEGTSAAPNAKPDAGTVHERKVPYGWVWIGFLAMLVCGAALQLHPSTGARAFGLTLILGPAAAFGLMILLYYVRSRRG